MSRGRVAHAHARLNGVKVAHRDGERADKHPTDRPTPQPSRPRMPVTGEIRGMRGASLCEILANEGECEDEGAFLLGFSEVGRG